MFRCKCGKLIGYFDKYCKDCEKNLNLREKTVERIRKDKVFDASNHGKALLGGKDGI